MISGMKSENTTLIKTTTNIRKIQQRLEYANEREKDVVSYTYQSVMRP